MPERPDLRTITGNIRDSLAECDRDALLDMLTFVFKEYVVEGPPPLLVHQAERIQDLENLSFAQLITALQTRLDVPELSLFQVEGDQVSVRVGGVMTPLAAPRGGVQTEVAPPAPAAQAPSPPRVQIIETDMVRRPPGGPTSRAGADQAQARRGDLAGMARDAVNQAMQQESSAPPPNRGVSIRGRTTGGSMMPEPAARETPASAPAPPRGSEAQPAAREADPPGDDDSAATRFSLLELD
jgi:hypothetical protein